MAFPATVFPVLVLVEDLYIPYELFKLLLHLRELADSCIMHTISLLNRIY